MRILLGMRRNPAFGATLTSVTANASVILDCKTEDRNSWQVLNMQQKAPVPSLANERIHPYFDLNYIIVTSIHKPLNETNSRWSHAGVPISSNHQFVCWKMLMLSRLLFPCVVWLDCTVPPPTVTFYEPCLESELVLRSFLTARPNQSGKERYRTLDYCSLQFHGLCSN